MVNRTRALVLSLLSAAALAAAGCGSDSGSPLGNALSYLPADSPIVIAIETDLDGGQAKSLERIVKKFPIAGQLEQSLEQSLEREGLDFEKDIQPLLGNEFVVGAADVRTVVDDEDDQAFVGALEVGDQGKLEDALEKGDAREAGEKSGAKLYEGSDRDFFAVDEDMLVVAGSRALLEAALERSDGDDSLDEETFDEATAELPEDALLRVSADLEQVIKADPDARAARKVEWVGALRDLGLTVSAKDDSISLDYRITTEGDLSEDDLPLAAGDASPKVIDRPNEIGFGIRGVPQIVQFAEAAAQTVNPGGFGDYATGKRTLERQLEIDVERDLLEQIEGDVSASVSLDGKFGVRASLKDPAEFERTLAKLGKALPAFAEGATGQEFGYSAPKDGEGFYALSTADGDAIVYRVADGAFVLANDPERAAELATAEPKAVPGAEGAVVVSADAQQLVQQILSRVGGVGGALGGAFVAGPLGDLRGSTAVTQDAISGNLRLGFDG